MIKNPPPLAEIPSADEIHAALVKALEDARDAIPAARKTRNRITVAQAVENRIECVRVARSHGMPFDEIAGYLGVSVSYAQKLIYRNQESASA